MSKEHDDETGGVEHPGPLEKESGDLASLNVDELHERAAQLGIEGRCRMGKEELLEALTARGR